MTLNTSTNTPTNTSTLFPTLEELAAREGQFTPEDISEYGLKSEGLVELIRARPLFKKMPSYRNTPNGFEQVESNEPAYEIPPGFVVPKSLDISIQTSIDGLKESYFALTENEQDYCVILARSSSENEKSGKFDTLFAVYNPAKKKESFDKFMASVSKVRSNPSKAVIVQKMVGEVDYCDNYEKEDILLLEVPLISNENDFDKIVAIIKEKDPRGACFGEYTTFVQKDGLSLYFNDIYVPAYNAADLLKNAFDTIYQYVRDNTEENNLTDSDFEPGKLKVEIGVEYKGRRPVIGATNTAFTSRSHSHLDPNEGIINACLGLTSQLVNGTDEMMISSIKYGPKREGGIRCTTVIGTATNYHSSSTEYTQNMIEVFDVLEEKVKRVDRDWNSHPFWTYNNWPVPMGIHNHMDLIGELTNFFSKKLDCPIELEGCAEQEIEDGNLYIFQLTKSRILEMKIPRLKSVSKKQIILPFEKLDGTGALGSIDFHGDIIFYSGSHHDIEIDYISKHIGPPNDESAIIGLLKKYCAAGKKPLFIASGFRDDLCYHLAENSIGTIDSTDSTDKEANRVIINYVNFSSQAQVLNEMGFPNDKVGNSTMHVLGYLTQELHERKLKGHNTCCVWDKFDIEELASRNLGKYNNRREVIPPITPISYVDQHFISGPPKSRIVIFKDAVFEATKGKYQIYFK